MTIAGIGIGAKEEPERFTVAFDSGADSVSTNVGGSVRLSPPKLLPRLGSGPTSMPSSTPISFSSAMRCSNEKDALWPRTMD
jgi:hypothetical protein